MIDGREVINVSFIPPKEEGAHARPRPGPVHGHDELASDESTSEAEHV